MRTTPNHYNPQQAIALWQSRPNSTHHIDHVANCKDGRGSQLAMGEEWCSTNYDYMVWHIVGTGRGGVVGVGLWR